MITHVKYVLLVSTLILPGWMLGCMHVQASGMKPERSVLLIDEGQGEASLNIKNTDSGPLLLVSEVYSPEGEEADLILISPPMARVEGGQTQSVRFFLEDDTPSPVQRLRRVTFEGVHPDSTSGTSNVGMTFMHDLPVIISPAGLKKELTPWVHLKWRFSGDTLIVENPSPYVVRMLPNIDLLPGKQKVALPKSYILPGQILQLDVPQQQRPNATKVMTYPVNINGYSVDPVSAPVDK